MKRLFETFPIRMRRILEISIPFLAWVIITLPLWLSFWHPALVAYFVILFDVYWFYKSATLAIYGLRAYAKLGVNIQIDWLTEVKKLPHWKKIYHVIIIPEYKEPLSVLRDTLTNLALTDFPKENIFIVLATEERDDTALETAEKLRDEYVQRFGNFWITRHPELSREVKGKSSNMAWAGKWVAEKIKELKIDMGNVTVTSCDADALLHPKYYSYLTHKYLTDKERYYHFYQTAVMFYSNIWRIPLPGRVLNTIGSVWSLAKLEMTDRLINFSTYSVSLKTVVEVGYWGTDIIPEDYHLFFKTYFAKGEKVSAVPIFLPTMVDAAESTTFRKTMVNQYEQNKRWAWGVSDDPWVIRNFFLHPEIPLGNRIWRLFHLLEEHLLWPVNWFILTLGSTIPPLVNQSFARTVLGRNLSLISSVILTISALFLIVVIVLDIKLKPPCPVSFKKWRSPILFLQWVTLPVVGFFLSTLPGLDAHTRLMLGKRLEYRVTEKV